MKLLAAAGSAVLLASCASVPQADVSQPLLAITIDDLPVHGDFPPSVTPRMVGDQMTAALTAGGVPAAYGFVNAGKLRDDPEAEIVLRGWRAAGMMLGNHGWSHRHLSEMSLDEFEQELVTNEPVLERNAGRTDSHWFRYPFLDEGKDARQRAAARAVLAKHHYRVAAVTMSFGDWQWTEPYARCSARHDDAAIAELERIYLAAAEESIAASRDASRKLFGREIPYVLLMHVSAMSARMMPQLLQTYRQAGFRFVTLADAESDPAYRGYMDLKLAPPASPQELARQKGVKLMRTTDYAPKLETICT